MFKTIDWISLGVAFAARSSLRSMSHDTPQQMGIMNERDRGIVKDALEDGLAGFQDFGFAVATYLNDVICTSSVPIWRWVRPAGVGTSANFDRRFS